MKLYRIVKVAMLALPLVFAACGSHKKTIKTPVSMTPDVRERVNFISSVQENAQTAKFITSKVKFSVEVGPQKLTLTGNLKMKRDDVIRLQLMAFGFVEAGRIEMTKEYVLIMDRINKQYLKAPWMSVDFLTEKISNDSLATFNTIESGDDMIISLEEGKMDYSWLASKQSALIKMANILYKDRFNGNSQLNWDYDQFEKLNKTLYPRKHAITLNTADKEVKLGMTLNYIGADTEWEPRTEISNKYREVTVDEILRRFMAL